MSAAARRGLGEERGRVTEFDGRRGLGTVEGAGGTVYPFHCSAIADGTRTVEVGAEVRFTVVPGNLGRWEASDIGPAVTGPAL